MERFVEASTRDMNREWFCANHCCKNFVLFFALPTKNKEFSHVVTKVQKKYVNGETVPKFNKSVDDECK